nr:MULTISPECIES: type II toxin-antitoxin system HigB family toxin [unclassified Rhizobium]
MFPYWEYRLHVQVITKSTLRTFWERHPQARIPLGVWHATVVKAQWSGPADVKRMFGANVDFVGDNRVIFDIGGNKYRLIVHVAYSHKRVLVKFVGTHAEYDRIDPETIR